MSAIDRLDQYGTLTKVATGIGNFHEYAMPAWWHLGVLNTDSPGRDRSHLEHPPGDIQFEPGVVDPEASRVDGFTLSRFESELDIDWHKSRPLQIGLDNLDHRCLGVWKNQAFVDEILLRSPGELGLANQGEGAVTVYRRCAACE